MKKAKRVLIIAYSFPPCGLVGALRPFKFAKYLPDYGWEPVILARKVDNHLREIDESLLDQLKPCLKISRVTGIEPKDWFQKFLKQNSDGNLKIRKADNHFIAKKYFIELLKRFWRTWVEIPDSHIGWFPFAFLKAFKIIRKEKIDVIYSTSDPFTSHLIGLCLKMITKKPWVADFRDPWTQYSLYEYHSNTRKKIDESLERRFLRVADLITVTSDLTAKGFITKYPSVERAKIITITNGFDPFDFKGFNFEKKNPKFTITYTGNFFLVSSSNKFLEAVYEFLGLHPHVRSKIIIRFIGLLDNFSQQLIDSLALHDVVKYLGYVPYRNSLQYQAESDVLLLTRSLGEGNASTIPAKLFEYLAIRKPILALIPTEGDAAKLVREAKCGVVVSPDDKDMIRESIYDLYSKYETHDLAANTDTFVLKRYERKYLTNRLSKLFNTLIPDQA